MFSRDNMWKASFRRIFWTLALLVFCLLLVPFVREFFFERIGRWLYILLFASSTAALLTPIMMVFAARIGIVDAPGGRKIHTKVTPLLGGVAVIISFISALLANMILDARDIILISGGTVVAIVGLIDDWKNIPARYKIFIQVFVV